MKVNKTETGRKEDEGSRQAGQGGGGRNWWKEIKMAALVLETLLQAGGM